MKRENPFPPEAAGPPSVLAGRDEELRQIQKLTDDLADGQWVHNETILYGPRGNGKTTLLLKVTADLKKGSKVKPVLVQTPTITSPGQLFQRLLGETFDVTETTFHYWEEKCIATMAMEPTLLMVDEAQTITDDVVAAILWLTDVARRGKTKFAVIFAGTPTLPLYLIRFAGYLERTQQIRMERLDVESTRTALFQPFEDAGWNNRLNQSQESSLLERTQQYPYFIQCIGHAIWDAAEREGNIEINARTLASAKPHWEQDVTSMYTGGYQELARNRLIPCAEAIATEFQRAGRVDVVRIREIIAEIAPDAVVKERINQLEGLGYIWADAEKHFLYKPGIPSLMDHVLGHARDREKAKQQRAHDDAELER